MLLFYFFTVHHDISYYLFFYWYASCTSQSRHCCCYSVFILPSLPCFVSCPAQARIACPVCCLGLCTQLATSNILFGLSTSSESVLWLLPSSIKVIQSCSSSFCPSTFMYILMVYNLPDFPLLVFQNQVQRLHKFPPAFAATWETSFVKLFSIL